MLKVIKDLVLDEKGEPILTGNAQLPAKVFLKVIGKNYSNIGKSKQTIDSTSNRPI